MTQFVIAVVSGLATGGVFALVASGLVLGFRSTGTMNFAHGQFMLLAAYLVGAGMTNRGWSFLPIAAIGVMSAALVGAGFYLLVLQRTIGLPHFIGVVASFGLAAVLDGVIHLTLGDDVYRIAIPGMPEGVWTVLDARVSARAIVVAVFTTLLAFTGSQFLKRTRAGIQIQAAGQIPLLASQGGINVRRVYLGSWAVAGALSAVAGIAYGSVFVVSASMVGVLFAVFPAILLGGLDSIDGAIVGGLCIGVLQSFVASYLGSDYVDVTTYSVLLAVLLIRPAGFFGTVDVSRA